MDGYSRLLEIQMSVVLVSITMKQKLQTLLDELEQQQQDAQESAKPVKLDQTRVGRLSRMDAMQLQAMSIASSQRRELEMQRIRAALDRVDNEEYGYCLECGDDINPQRLEVDLAATLCIRCADASEQASS